MARTIMVKCKICGQEFNRNAVPCQQQGRRYIHETCLTDSTKKEIQEDEELKELEDYIKEKYNISVISAKIKKQIRDFRAEYNYSYNGILKTLIWWFDIQNHPATSDKTYGGIGIVPFVYDQAKEYYYKLWLIQEVNNLAGIDAFKREIEEVEIESPRVQTNSNKLFNI